MKKLLMVLAVLSLTSCTVIRYVDPPDEDMGPGNVPPPKYVDMLVMAELNREAFSLSDSYSYAVAEMIAAMAANQIIVRKWALAPMYRRTGGTVPLIYGSEDENPEFSNLGEAVVFFAMDDGVEYLRERALSEGENLASLGRELDTRSIYHPTSADVEGRPYFEQPADGFVVLQLTAKKRECAYTNQACQINGTSPAAYFTKEADGKASWLELPNGAGLPASKIYHISIATGEGIDFDTFADDCEGRQDFPQTKLDFMEPSPNVYYEPFMRELNDNGSGGSFLDMCLALSPLTGLPEMGVIGRDIRTRL